MSAALRACFARAGVRLLLPSACLLILATGDAEARSSRRRVRAVVTKGAPAKGPSPLSFSETVDKRRASLGQPVGEEQALQGALSQNVSSLQAQSELDRADRAASARLRSALQGDPGMARKADSEGRTLLHQAAFAGYRQTVSLLLDHGADRSARDIGGATPAESARRGGHADLAALIESYRAREK